MQEYILKVIHLGRIWLLLSSFEYFEKMLKIMIYFFQKSHSRFISMLTWSKFKIYQNILHRILFKINIKNLMFTYLWINNSTSTSILLPPTNFLLSHPLPIRERLEDEGRKQYSVWYVPSIQQTLLNKQKQRKIELSRESCKREDWGGKDKIVQGLKNTSTSKSWLNIKRNHITTYLNITLCLKMTYFIS